jgi:phosphoribosylaminoimidazolecarboxamide formyltransferase/IMP cyclohydrolase
MHLLTPGFLERYPQRILNVHPSLLPTYPGRTPIEDALADRVEVTGVTVHLVDGGVDAGPILVQERVPVKYDDTPESLRERIHAVEHRLLPETVMAFVQGAVDVREGYSVRIQRALISVFDKTGLEPFARGLVDLGVELIATSKTAAFLEDLGLSVTKVEDLTGVADMLGGRVRTLHPKVHGALLARRDVEEDRKSLAEHGIEPIDLVVSNLYPFVRLSARRDVSESDLIEAIDIGGPTMIRAAAKNHAFVAVVVDPERYGFLLDELSESGEVSSLTRRELAAEAFTHTAGYDIAIANWFLDAESFPDRTLREFVKLADLPYGENPHQRAAYYVEVGARRHLLSRVEQHGGNPLSFNNLLDLNAASGLIDEFSLPACVIVKHGNPCGVALAGSVEEAYRRALAADPMSAYGGVVAVNRAVSVPLAEALAEQFVDVLYAPAYADGALDVLRRKPGVRLLENAERRGATPGERDYRRVLGGLLIQDRDSESEDRSLTTVATKAQPTEAQWGDLLFAWRVAKHVRSNAVVLARDLVTLGVGAGQMSRVDASRIALDKALQPAEGAACASDAFFPFADGIEGLVAAGVRAVIQPGGSKRDDEVIAAADAAGVAMVFTGRRHFAH